MENQTNKTEGFNKLRQVVFKVIDSATLRAKNRRVSIALPNGIMIKLSPFDLNIISSTISIAYFSHEYDNLKLDYVDDNNLELKSIKLSLNTLKSISTFLNNLSLRIDLKSSYRLYRLSTCKTTKELMKLLNEINTEEGTIETDYLEH